PGDVDFFKIQVKAGQEISFLNGAMLIGSTLQPVVSILDSELNTVREFGLRGGAEQIMFAHRFEKAGAYYVRITDYQHGGRNSHFYRIMAGEFPLVLGAFPLGVKKGSQGDLALRGYHVGKSSRVQMPVSPKLEDTLLLRPDHSFNQIRLAAGAEPEITA